MKMDKKKLLRVDDAIAMQRFALMRYFASGLIAGGAGVTLTMLLGATTIYPQSYSALGCIDIFMTAGCIYYFYSGCKWMGLPPGKSTKIFSLLGIAYMLLHTLFSHPSHKVLAFSGFWWSLVVTALITIIIGATFRYLAELEIEDLQYGFDHGTATVTDIREIIKAEKKHNKTKSSKLNPFERILKRF